MKTFVQFQEERLTADQRRALPNKDFALPGKGEGPKGKQAGSYPIPDEKHARSALSMVSQHGTPEEKATVRAKVKKKFPGIQQEARLDEEGYDRMRDDRLVKYGIGHDGSDRKGPSPRPTGKQPKGDTVYQKEMKKKYGGKLPSALQVVTDKIKEKHGKGAIYNAK